VICVLRAGSGACISPRWPSFDPGQVHVRFVAVKLALSHFPVGLLRFSPDSIILQVLHTHLHLSTTLIRRTTGRSMGTFSASNVTLPVFERSKKYVWLLWLAITHNYVIYSITQAIKSTNTLSLDILTKGHQHASKSCNCSVTFLSSAHSCLQYTSVARPASAQDVTACHRFKQFYFTRKSHYTFTLQNQTNTDRHHAPPSVAN
jgi:hypothetical protein